MFYCHQELSDVVCIDASPNGKLVYASDSDGCLHCIDASHREVVATWKPDDASATGGAPAAAIQQPAILTSLNATVLSDNAHLITAVDNTGFYFRIHV